MKKKKNKKIYRSLYLNCSAFGCQFEICCSKLLLFSYPRLVVHSMLHPTSRKTDFIAKPLTLIL